MPDGIMPMPTRAAADTRDEEVAVAVLVGSNGRSHTYGEVLHISQFALMDALRISGELRAARQLPVRTISPIGPSFHTARFVSLVQQQANGERDGGPRR